MTSLTAIIVQNNIMNNWGTCKAPLKYRMYEILWNFTTFFQCKQWRLNLCTSREEWKKSYTHFSKYFPCNILNLYIRAQCPHLSNNIQPPLLQEIPVLFSLNKCCLNIQRYESRNCSNNDMTFRAWNKEIIRPHLTSKGLGSSSYILNGFHMKQHF